MSPEQALEALDVFWRSGQPEHSLRLTMELSSRVSIDALEAGDLTALSTAWDRLAPCVDAATEDVSYEVNFGELGTCDLLGSPAVGGVRYALEAVDGEVAANITLLPFGASSWSAAGDMVFVWGADDVHALDASLIWSNDGVELGIETSVTYTPAAPEEGLWGLVTVDGERVVTAADGAWRIELTEADVQHPMPMPIAGSARITAPDGAEMMATFTPDGDVIRIDAVTGAREFTLELARDGSSLEIVD